MRKQIQRSIICCLFSLLFVWVVVPAGAQEQNLLTNPGFEAPFQSLDGVPPRQVAQGWTPWHVSGGASASENIQPEYYPATDTTNGLGVPRIRSGSDAQQYQTFFATHDGGLYQRVNGVSNGAQLTFTAYIYVWSSSFDDVNKSEQDGGIVVQVGIDPTGGTDATSGAIVWSQPNLQYDAYNQYSVTTSALNNAVTVFIRSTVSVPVKNNNIYVDDASLTTAATIPATATNTAIPQPTATNTVEPTPTQQTDASATPVPPSATPIPVEPSATSIVVAVASATPTQESLAPSATPLPPTATSLPPTSVPTPQGGFQSNITHIVQQGDTVGNLATLYGSTIEAIISANGLSASAFIRVGQSLLIPVRQPPVIPATATPTSNAPVATAAPGSSQTFVYVVQPGDTLLRVAVRFSTNIATLSQLNGITNPNVIRVGQRLLIPTGPGAVVTGGGDVSGAGVSATTQPPASQNTTYIVRGGDTLYKIALRFKRSVAQLMQANNLNNPNFIFVGQVLVIP